MQLATACTIYRTDTAHVLLLARLGKPDIFAKFTLGLEVEMGRGKHMGKEESKHETIVGRS
jgi:hypothetical protein